MSITKPFDIIIMRLSPHKFYDMNNLFYTRYTMNIKSFEFNYNTNIMILINN